MKLVAVVVFLVCLSSSAQAYSLMELSIATSVTSKEALDKMTTTPPVPTSELCKVLPNYYLCKNPPATANLFSYCKKNPKSPRCKNMQ